MKYIKHPDIEMRDSETHGRGIFSKGFIKEGTILEECHYIYIHRGNKVNLISRYMYRKGNQKNGPSFAIVLGFGSIYNSSKENKNVKAHLDEEKDVYVFTATQDIQPGDELFMSYGKFLRV